MRAAYSGLSTRRAPCYRQILVKTAGRDATDLVELERRIETVPEGGKRHLDALLPDLIRATRGERAILYSLTPEPSSVRVDAVATSGIPARRFRDLFDALLARPPTGWAAYDPFRPAPKDRNRAVVVMEQIGREKLEAMPLYQEVITPVGLGRDHQLRLLLCEGGTLLGCLGIFRSEPFGEDERAVLRKLTPALLRRLRLENQLAAAHLSTAALGPALDAIPGAAFVVDDRGRVHHVNAAARAMLERDAGAAHEEIAETLAGRSEPSFEVSRLDVRGAAAHYLLVRRPRASEPTDRLDAMARRYGLTQRQEEVLALLIRGATNKTIAAVLGCTVHTAKTHVKHLLERTGADSRSALVAQFWAPGQ
jgi:DNA-binding CsgD family transcriptional regulator